MRRAIGSTAAAIALFLGAAASPAAAADRPANTGLCGARNMSNPSAQPHMAEAMAEHTAPQGDDGMRRAVRESSC